MTSLMQLQRDLQHHVLHDDDAIVTAILSSDAVPAVTRLQIYSDAYRLRLIEALQTSYPVLAQLLGEESFARIGRQYLAKYPSRHFSARWFGDRLDEFLRDSEEYAAQPWLAEMAEWEWKIAAAFDAEDAAAITTDRLATIALEDWPELRFTFHPSLRRVALHTNVVAIAKAVEESTMLEGVTESPSEWLIWRPELTVRYRPLEAAEAAALDALLSGANFGEMCEVVAEYADPEQAAFTAASLLKQWISEQSIIDVRTA